MVIKVNKDTKSEELEAALRQLKNSKKKPLFAFYGKLKGVFGDGLEYQKMMRS